jgi:hypothetical protein
MNEQLELMKYVMNMMIVVRVKMLLTKIRNFDRSRAYVERS